MQKIVILGTLMWILVSQFFNKMKTFRHLTPEYEFFVPAQAILYAHNVSELRLRLK